MVLGVSKEIAQTVTLRSEETAPDPLVLISRPEFPLIVDSGQRSVAEHFGVIRARLLKAQSSSAFNSVLISSPQAQDGKSMTSANLAISLAQVQQQRVLLVDGDMRVRGITHGLGSEEQLGLADFLQDSASFKETIRPTNLPHLSIAPAGNVVGNLLPRILQGPRWIEFMQKSRQEFDLVIVDSVPVSAPIADFELLLQGCDAVLLVVHLRKTRRALLQQITNQVHGKLLGVILNDEHLKSDFGYGTSYADAESK
jgi:capsular exopolysaccharide synthesis family protein